MIARPRVRAVMWQDDRIFGVSDRVQRFKIVSGWCGLLLAAVLLFVGVFAGVLVWRISEGPVSLHRLVPYVIAELNKSSGDAKFSVDDMVLYWRGWEERFDVRLRNVSVATADGHEMLRVPEADVTFSTPALFDGVLALRDLSLIAPTIRLMRRADGTVDIGYTATGNNTGNAGADQPAASGIDEFGSDDIALQRPGVLNGPSATLPVPAPVAGADQTGAGTGADSDVAGSKGGAANVPAADAGQTGGGAEAADAVDTGDAGNAGAEMRRGIRDGNDALREIIAILSGEAKDIPAAAYFESFGVFDADLQVRDEALGVIWGAPAANIRLTRQDGGIHATASLRVKAADLAADVELTGDYARQSDEITLSAAIRDFIPADLASISDVFRNLDEVNIPVSGVITATLAGDGSVRRAGIDLDLENGRLDLPEWMHATYNITGGKAKMSFVPGRLNFDDVRLDIGESDVVVTGGVDDPLGKWALDVGARATRVKTDDLKNLWPQGVGQNARDWVVENLSDGIVHQAEIHARLHQDDAGSVAVDTLGGQMDMTGITVNYLGDMPPVINAGGRAEFDGTSFTIHVDQGTALGMTVDQATLTFSELHTDDPLADMEIVVHGPARDALELIDAQPLGFATRLGILPGQISGEHATRVKLHFPLLNDLGFDQVQVAAASRIENAALTDVFRDLDIADGAFELQVNTSGLELLGDARIGTGKTGIDWVESFNDKTPVISHYKLTGDLDLGAMIQAGIDPAPYLSGMAKGTLSIDHMRNGSVVIDGDTDITGVALDIAPIQYAKAAGQDGTLKFGVTIGTSGGGELRNASLMAPEMVLNGKGRWRGEKGSGDQFTINLANSRFRENLGVSGAITRDADGRLLAEMSGQQFDLRPVLAENDDANAIKPGASPDIAHEGQNPDATAKPDTRDAPGRDGRRRNRDAQGGSALPDQLDVSLQAPGFLIKGDQPVLHNGNLRLIQTGRNRQIEIRAEQALAEPWIADSETPSQPGPVDTPNSGGIGQSASRRGGKTDVLVHIDQVIMANGELINEVEGAIHMIGDEWDSLELNGSLGDHNSLSAEVIRKDDATRTVRLTSEDAGKFLRAVDLYGNILGGAMTIEGSVDDTRWSRPFSGKANITAFRAVNAPIAARVLGAASLTGLLDVLQGNGIAFDALNCDFTYSSDVLALSRCAANGGAVGVTSNGSIDLAKSEIRLAGSIVPLYALNSALGAIPLLGDLLVGEEGGGLFAPTYTIEGNLDEPDVTVNPLSTLVPGVLRNLITGAEPG